MSLLNFLDSLTAPLAQNVPSVISFRAAMSRAWSAAIRFSRECSPSLFRPSGASGRRLYGVLHEHELRRSQSCQAVRTNCGGRKVRTTSSRRCCFEVKQHDGS